KEWNEELQNFLLQYRTTQHTVTGITPAEKLMGRQLRNKMPSYRLTKDQLTKEEKTAENHEREKLRKLRSQEDADRSRSATPSDIAPGDVVLAKDMHRANKLAPTFEPTPYTVAARNGNAVTLQ
ncbi:hypothetical protein CAPTEDRAFT_27547, partial [Capitella teleta]